MSALDDGVPAHVENEFRDYLKCGILAHGFAQARCSSCGYDFLVAVSCKGRSASSTRSDPGSSEIFAAPPRIPSLG